MNERIRSEIEFILICLVLGVPTAGALTIAISWLVFTFAPPGIGPKIAPEGLISCESEETFRELIHARATSDQGYITYLLGWNGACFERSRPARVTALDSGWIFQDMRVVLWVKYRTFPLSTKGGTFEDVYPTPAWTYFDALEDVPPET